ncbi:hypothetical protein Tsubulata_019313 [Turnera subulata]|uniref:Uncharacterized protein n=1 Tax=Turnera subulata TaxID=218843 RepID=A0A9Q0GKW0_9ROSI|nr:hypothetical protein Tsubulata_019313 [Turnera subulata]
MVKAPRCDKEGLKKGPWTVEEDQKLLAYVQEHGHGSWRSLPVKAGLQRCGKSCRLRWTNYLRPDIKRGKFSLPEEQTIIQLHALLGNRWSAIAKHLPKRTDNEIKNYWNTHLKKRLDKMGIDPVTHKPKANVFGLGTGQAKDAATLSHVAQWERARLEAEARWVRESKTIPTSNINPPPPYQCPPAARSIKNKEEISGRRPAAAARPPCLDVLKAWQGVVFDMFSAKGNSIKSPTSTLTFPETSPRLVPGAATHEKSTAAPGGYPADNDIIVTNNPDDHQTNNVEGSEWECFDKLNQVPQMMNQQVYQSSVAMHGMGSPATNFCDAYNDSAWFLENTCFAEANDKAPVMDELTHILARNPEDKKSSLGELENNNGSVDSAVQNTTSRYYWEMMSSQNLMMDSNMFN